MRKLRRRNKTPRKPAGFPRLLRGLLPKLSPDQVTALAIAHHTHVDLVASGKGTIDTLWEMAAAALGWSRVAQVLQVGEPEMARDCAVIDSLIKRFERTGRVVYTGPELQTARQGLEAVDQLARLTDLPTAIEAVNWAEDRINAARAAHDQRIQAERQAAAAAPPAAQAAQPQPPTSQQPAHTP